MNKEMDDDEGYPEIQKLMKKLIKAEKKQRGGHDAEVLIDQKALVEVLLILESINNIKLSSSEKTNVSIMSAMTSIISRLAVVTEIVDAVSKNDLDLISELCLKLLQKHGSEGESVRDTLEYIFKLNLSHTKDLKIKNKDKIIDSMKRLSKLLPKLLEEL